MKFYTPILSAIEKAAQDGLREAAERTLERSNELAPELTGESKDSGFIEVDDLTVQIGYTSFVSLLQHEKLEFKHPRGGQAKFLETASEEIAAELGDIMAVSMRAQLGG